MRKELLEGGYYEPVKDRWHPPRLLPESAMKRALLVIAVFIIFVYALLVGTLAWMQASLIYNPTATVRMTSQEWEWHDVAGDDGFKAYLRKGDPDKPIVVFYHGRSQGLWSIDASTRHYARAGWTVLAPEYPGFAGLAGEPSEEALDRLVDAVHEDVVTMGYGPDRIVIQGNSLGAGPALSMASRPHSLLVLTAPVASMAEIVDGVAPFFPHLLLYNGWDNENRARHVAASRSMVFHARDDSVVPYDHGERLARILGAEFTPFEEGDHFIGTEVGETILERLAEERT